MQKKNLLIKGMEKFIAKMAKKAASIEANTTCPGIGYQHKEPPQIKKLRKF